VVDTTVVVSAERVGGPDQVVEVLTSDVRDAHALAAHANARVDVVRL
jgi:hypothetical protein